MNARVGARAHLARAAGTLQRGDFGDEARSRALAVLRVELLFARAFLLRREVDAERDRGCGESGCDPLLRSLGGDFVQLSVATA